MTAPGRPKKADRITPHFDSWRNELERALSDRGSKTRLALYLAHNDLAKLNSYKVAISKTLATKIIPDGEFVLAINAWLKKQKRTNAKPR